MAAQTCYLRRCDTVMRVSVAHARYYFYELRTAVVATLRLSATSALSNSSIGMLATSEPDRVRATPSCCGTLTITVQASPVQPTD